MKYIIIGYTSDINIKTNTAVINYLRCEDEQLHWSDNISDAITYNSRREAEEVITKYDLIYAVSYGIKKENNHVKH